VSVTLFYPQGSGHFPRAYIRGFYTDDDYPIVNLFGGVLELTQIGYDVQIYLQIRSAFIVPTSNVYTLDYVFDAGASEAYYLGTPYAAGIYIQLVNDPVDFSWRIRVNGSNTPGTPTRVDLAPKPLYWRPL